MKPAPFDYVKARSVADACMSLADGGTDTAAIAGGQSLLPMLSLRVALPEVVVDLGGLDELKEVSATADTVRIGALTTHATIEDGKLPDAFGGMMQRVASKISYRAVRNYGTIGGSVALADPAADWPGCLMALRAKVRISGNKGARSELLEDFVHGQYATSLAPGEIILGFDIPRPDRAMRWGVFKVVRKSGAFAQSIAFAVEQGKGGPVSVVLAAAAATPRALPGVANAIMSGKSSEAQLRAAITVDIAKHAPQQDPYLMRLHTSTVLRAVLEMKSR
ncbi:MAG TPA: FAD binding domain-containing protein [Xanthobacteraceae bacterium]|jgi:carbon-monoxide dehydrogenase medium subunit